MLSSQTTDQMTSKAMSNLLKYGLTIENLLTAEKEEVKSMISSVGFANRKTEYICKVAEILKHQYNSDIPDNIDELVKLPGVGPKMAYLAMQCAWSNCQGIGVDVHVHRIANRLCWTGKYKTSTPEQTRIALENNIPKNKWSEINKLLVGFGQTVCKSSKPLCSQCPLSSTCPYLNPDIKDMF
ncbi:MAG: Endonuclease III-like protein 1 [Paramarteilia canceri]